MARTTAEMVGEVIEVDPTITNLTPFIEAAALVVNAQCPDITEATGTIVETWLAAHFYGIRDQRVSSEAVSGVSQSYQYKVDLGLSVTHYGQMAMSLDDTGGLSKWNKDIVDGRANAKLGAVWLGTEATT